MILCLDFGNTNKKLSIFKNREIVLFKYLDSFNTEDLQKIISGYSIRSILISAVIEIPTDFIAFLETHGKVTLINHQVADKKLHYTTYEPSTLGIDRKLMAIGALRQLPAHDLLIICLGTCITYNVVTKEREFIGGVISPGLEMRAKSLNAFTEKLPLIDWKATPIQMQFGKNTTENLQLGVFESVYFELAGWIKLFKNQYPLGKVIFTGGDASHLLSKKTFNDIHLEERLLWRGMLEFE